MRPQSLMIRSDLAKRSELDTYMILSDHMHYRVYSVSKNMIFRVLYCRSIFDNSWNSLEEFS